MEQSEIILCDTDVIIELYRNNSVVVRELKKIKQSNISLSVITAGELLYGALNKRELNRIKKDLDNLLILDIDRKTCEIFLDLMSTYSLSNKLSVPDCFIASTAIANNIELYSLNLKDFSYIDGLKLYKPKKTSSTTA